MSYVGHDDFARGHTIMALPLPGEERHGQTNRQPASHIEDTWTLLRAYRLSPSHVPAFGSRPFWTILPCKLSSCTEAPLISHQPGEIQTGCRTSHPFHKCRRKGCHTLRATHMREGHACGHFSRSPEHGSVSLTEDRNLNDGGGSMDRCHAQGVGTPSQSSWCRIPTQLC